MILDELAARLVSQSVGTLGTNIFTGSSAVIPTGTGPYLTLSETGGAGPTRVQNASTPFTQRPTVQVLVRAKRIAGVQEAYPAARAMSKLAYSALDGIFNTLLSGTFYLRLVARQEPTDMGIDAAGFANVVFNVEATKYP